MTHTVRVWRPTGRILALAVAIAAAPLPALAGETASPAHARPGISVSGQKIAAAEPLTATPRAAASAQGTSTDLGSKSFFKSPAGIIALIAGGVAVGATIYSTSNDRITSPKVPYEGGVR